MSALEGQPVRRYHVFLASPGDVDDERQIVREFFDEYNRTTAGNWNAEFVLVDWEKYSTAGVGRGQALITQQTLEKCRPSLALVVGLMAQKFGSGTGTHDSGTEEEFEWALDSYKKTGWPEIKWFFKSIDRFDAPPEADKIEEALEQWRKVEAFRKRVQLDPDSQLYYKTFKDVQNFKDVLRNDLSLWLADPSRPWHPGSEVTESEPAEDGPKARPADDEGVRVEVAQLPSTGAHLFGRDGELKRLDDAWEDAGTNVISLVAWGGVGKSALINRWLAQIAGDEYRGATSVYAMSFFSQGTKETITSADVLVDAALRWFGVDDPTQGSPWEKGERLAGLVKSGKTLLMLDGLEPLQYPPGRDGGKLKDLALAALVRELAASNEGLCVITTRHQVADLDQWSQSTARVVELESLSDEAGAELLRALGVHGPDSELRLASGEFEGHGLALNLLGNYLRDVAGGDVRRRDEVSLLEEDEEQGGQARRVMASYEKWFGDGPEIAVLRLVGLFDRPAGGELVSVLRQPPAIAGLTDALAELTERQWQRALSRLRRAQLLANADRQDPDGLDAHPMVREYFGDRLRQDHPDAWQEGHSRLYEHLRDTTKELPDTIEEMASLYAAVAHGCRAGRHQEALDDIYSRRIQRGDEFFSTRKLGAIGSNLAALSGFFDPPWTRPIDGLTGPDQSWVLNQAGFDLTALGRLREAAQPMQAALDRRLVEENWLEAARDAINLSDLHLTMGKVERSLLDARQSVELSDRIDDPFRRMAGRTALAAALHQAGQVSEAQALFREAEQMQNENQPQYPLLYSFQGYLYCDLLLGQGEYEEVRRRAEQLIEWAELVRASLLAIALGHLSLGSAVLLEARRDDSSDFSEPAGHLDQAVEGLRRAGTQQHLPRGLLARAALRRITDDFDGAQADLEEALAIAERGSMGLHQADGHLEYARLHLALCDKDKARESLATASKMIDDMGYHRRDGEVQELEAQLG